MSMFYLLAEFLDIKLKISLATLVLPLVMEIEGTSLTQITIKSFAAYLFIEQIKMGKLA